MDKKRYLATKIDQLPTMFPVVGLIGSRQCGKSTLVKQLRPTWKYYDLESPDDYQLISNDPVTLKEKDDWLYRYHIWLDQSQEEIILWRRNLRNASSR